MSEIDRIPIAGLESQYGIPRSVLHDRMNALGIKRTKIGNKSYIDSKALELLNGLDAHMKANLPMALFLERVGRLSASQTKSPVDSPSSSQSVSQIAIASPITIQIAPAPAPFDNYRMLSEAAKEGWAIPTSELLPLLGLLRLPKLEEGKFYRRGFVFERVVPRRGRETEWKVAKD